MSEMARCRQLLSSRRKIVIGTASEGIMLHAVFIAICVVAVVFFPICIYGLIVDLRNQKGLIGDLTPGSHKHQ